MSWVVGVISGLVISDENDAYFDLKWRGKVMDIYNLGCHFSLSISKLMVIYVLGDFKSSPANQFEWFGGGKVYNFKYQEDQVCNFKDLLLFF